MVGWTKLDVYGQVLQQVCGQISITLPSSLDDSVTTSGIKNLKKKKNMLYVHFLTLCRHILYTVWVYIVYKHVVFQQI